MNSINISKNITDLRKTAGVTQEQLATALNVSSQAVSKWETNTCQPDTMTLPLISDYFHVSVDYLFYGKDYTYDDIYDKIRTKVSSFPQMSKDSYEEALKIFASAHHGISHGNLRGKELMYDEPTHITDENGVSLLSGKGYGAIITRRFFEDITPETAVFSSVIFGALSDKSALLTAMAIISMSDISYDELQEKLNFDDITLRAALDKLIQNSLTVLDPKGELLRSTGHLLRLKGYEVRVLDLLNMEKSHCYNPFVYLRDDNDVQRLVTNLFKSTTPKGSQSNDPFWDTAASMLLLALIFYLKYEAPPDEQNFPMVMEMLRAADMREDCDEYTSPLDEIQHYLRRPALAVQSLF